MERIYLDHASTTPIDKGVLEKMLPYLTDVYGNADSPHAVGRKAMSAVDTARDGVARLLGAKPSEIYFTSGGTESDNWAIIGGALAKKKEGRNKVILSSIEHHACLFAGERLEKEGFTVVYLPVNEGGRVEINALKSVMDESVALVCIMMANNETGVIQKTKELCEIAHSYGAYFFADGVQYAPHKRIDVKDLGVDMLSLSAHKFYGPKGCGALYIKNGVKVEKLVGGGEQERGLRGGTLNVASIVGLYEAYKKTVEEISIREEKLQRLKGLFLEQLKGLEGVSINGAEETLPALINIRFRGVDNATLLYAMDMQGVCLSAGSACASASVKPSHVLTAMGLTEEEAKESVRISFGKENTEEEAIFAGKLLSSEVKRLRNG